ncbi:MAG: ribosome biogenesis GTP-binding protein YihA/YsxC [bacterium]
MKVTSVEFVKSVVHLNEIPKGNLNEIAFAGRSNVGKSSLINCLLNRKKVAKTSATPGKTRQLNYFKINDKIYFVDLPGYGFAKASKQERSFWRDLIEAFIGKSPNLKGVVSILDSRIGVTDLDRDLHIWLRSLQVPLILVATKTDKLSRNQLANQLSIMKRQVVSNHAAEIIPFSAVKGTGTKEVWQAILNLME